MRKLLRVADIAELTGFTLHTVNAYISNGILPPSVECIGPVKFYARSDVDAHMKLHADVARPETRKSARLARRKRRPR